jgi:hypothetical protein
MFYQIQGKSPGTPAYGQCHSGNLHKQNGGHPLSPSVSTSQESVGLVSQSQCIALSPVYSRDTEHTGRPTDRESRVFLDRESRVFSDWKLNQTVFNSLYQKWGPLDIDLFASRLTFQLDHYVSWRPDPSAIHTDAFTLNWTTFRGYAFPPFAMIGRCLQLIQSQKVEHLVPMAPVWPTQAWCPLLLELCIYFPLLLPTREDLLIQRGKNHPLHQLQLAGWLLSTVATKQQEFLTKLEKFSWQPGEETPLAPIPQPGTSGVAGVLKGSLSIPFHHL